MLSLLSLIITVFMSVVFGFVLGRYIFVAPSEMKKLERRYKGAKWNM